MDYTPAQAESLRKIYIAVLEQSDQLGTVTESGGGTRDSVPKMGSRLDTLHRYARAYKEPDAAISQADALKRLEELFATLDPNFMQLFPKKAREDLFLAIGTAMTTSALRSVAPYNAISSTLWY